MSDRANNQLKWITGQSEPRFSIQAWEGEGGFIGLKQNESSTDRH